jgi:hypothetical protein
MSQEYRKTYNEIRDLITSNFPRFGQKERIRIDSQIKPSDSGFDDFILIQPGNEIDYIVLTSGKISVYEMKLIYINRGYTRSDRNDKYDFWEELDDMFQENVSGTNYNKITAQLDTEAQITYTEDDEIKVLDGFVVNLEILIGKF